MASVEDLKGELTAIDTEDRLYWQKKKPERHEKLEYFIRQERRHILMEELLQRMPGTALEASD